MKDFTEPIPQALLNIEEKNRSNLFAWRGQFSLQLIECLLDAYPVHKFQPDPERRLAVILEREATKWFKPAKGQFQIYYKDGADHLECQPDFVAETPTAIFMLEPKSKPEMADPVVLAKRDVAVNWCNHASAHAKTCAGKPWTYLLIPHDAIAENITLDWLAKQFGLG